MDDINVTIEEMVGELIQSPFDHHVYAWFTRHEDGIYLNITHDGFASVQSSRLFGKDEM